MVLESFVVGFALGFSLAAPPGPVLAQLAFETARGRWTTGLAVGLGATTADATFFLVTYLGLLAVVPGAKTLAVLGLGGAALMLYFARNAWRSSRRPLDVGPKGITGFPGGYLLAFLSPFNLAWWLTTGANGLAKWGLGLAGGFFFAILFVIVMSVLIVRYGSSKLERFETYVSYASALFLVGFAVFLFVHAARTFV